MYPNVKMSTGGEFRCGGVEAPTTYATEMAGETEYSLAFHEDRDFFLEREITQQGNSDKFTIFACIKPTGLHHNQDGAENRGLILGMEARLPNSAYNQLAFWQGGKICFYFALGDNRRITFITKSSFIDNGSFYNIHASFDKTKGVNESVEIRVNGVVCETDANIVDGGTDGKNWLDEGDTLYVGRINNLTLVNDKHKLNGLIHSIALIDGQAITDPLYFGDFDPNTRQFVPKKNIDTSTWTGNSFLLQGRDFVKSDVVNAGSSDGTVRSPNKDRLAAFFLNNQDAGDKPELFVLNDNNRLSVTQTQGTRYRTDNDVYPPTKVYKPGEFTGQDYIALADTPSLGVQRIQYMGSGEDTVLPHDLPDKPRAFVIFPEAPGSMNFWHERMRNNEIGASMGGKIESHEVPFVDFGLTDDKQIVISGNNNPKPVSFPHTAGDAPTSHYDYHHFTADAKDYFILSAPYEMSKLYKFEGNNVVFVRDVINHGHSWRTASINGELYLFCVYYPNEYDQSVRYKSEIVAFKWVSEVNFTEITRTNGGHGGHTTLEIDVYKDKIYLTGSRATGLEIASQVNDAFAVYIFDGEIIADKNYSVCKNSYVFRESTTSFIEDGTIWFFNASYTTITSVPNNVIFSTASYNIENDSWTTGEIYVVGPSVGDSLFLSMDTVVFNGVRYVMAGVDKTIDFRGDSGSRAILYRWDSNNKQLITEIVADLSGSRFYQGSLFEEAGKLYCAYGNNTKAKDDAINVVRWNIEDGTYKRIYTQPTNGSVFNVGNFKTSTGLRYLWYPGQENMESKLCPWDPEAEIAITSELEKNPFNEPGVMYQMVLFTDSDNVEVLSPKGSILPGENSRRGGNIFSIGGKNFLTVGDQEKELTILYRETVDEIGQSSFIPISAYGAIFTMQCGIEYKDRAYLAGGNHGNSGGGGIHLLKYSPITAKFEHLLYRDLGEKVYWVWIHRYGNKLVIVTTFSIFGVGEFDPDTETLNYNRISNYKLITDHQVNSFIGNDGKLYLSQSYGVETSSSSNYFVVYEYLPGNTPGVKSVSSVANGGRGQTSPVRLGGANYIAVTTIGPNDHIRMYRADPELTLVDVGMKISGLCYGLDGIVIGNVAYFAVCVYDQKKVLLFQFTEESQSLELLQEVSTHPYRSDFAKLYEKNGGVVMIAMSHVLSDTGGAIAFTIEETPGTRVFNMGNGSRIPVEGGILLSEDEKRFCSYMPISQTTSKIHNMSNITPPFTADYFSYSADRLKYTPGVGIKDTFDRYRKDLNTYEVVFGGTAYLGGFLNDRALNNDFRVGGDGALKLPEMAEVPNITPDSPYNLYPTLTYQPKDADDDPGIYVPSMMYNSTGFLTNAAGDNMVMVTTTLPGGTAKKSGKLYFEVYRLRECRQQRENMTISPAITLDRSKDISGDWSDYDAVGILIDYDRGVAITASPDGIIIREEEITDINNLYVGLIDWWDRTTVIDGAVRYSVNFGQEPFRYIDNIPNVQDALPPTAANLVSDYSIIDPKKFVDNKVITGTTAESIDVNFEFTPDFVILAKENMSEDQYSHIGFRLLGDNTVINTDREGKIDANGDLLKFTNGGVSLHTEATNVWTPYTNNFRTHIWAFKASRCSGIDVVEYTGGGNAVPEVSVNIDGVPDAVWIFCKDSNVTEPIIMSRHYINGNRRYFGKQKGLSSFACIEYGDGYFKPISVDDGPAINDSGNEYIAIVFKSVYGFSNIGTATEFGIDYGNVGAAYPCGFTPNTLFYRAWDGENLTLTGSECTPSAHKDGHLDLVGVNRNVGSSMFEGNRPKVGFYSYGFRILDDAWDWTAAVPLNVYTPSVSNTIQNLYMAFAETPWGLGPAR